MNDIFNNFFILISLYILSKMKTFNLSGVTSKYLRMIWLYNPTICLIVSNVWVLVNLWFREYLKSKSAFNKVCCCVRSLKNTGFLWTNLTSYNISINSCFLSSETLNLPFELIYVSSSSIHEHKVVSVNWFTCYRKLIN